MTPSLGEAVAGVNDFLAQLSNECGERESAVMEIRRVDRLQSDLRTILSALPAMQQAIEGYLSDCGNEECERCIAARAAIHSLIGGR